MNVRHRLRLPKIACFAAVCAGLSACATLQSDQARDTEALLAASGFKIKLADNPEKLAHLQTLTQHQLVPHEKEGKTFFIYADASACRCFYIGDEAAYQLYQEIAAQKEIAQDQMMAAQMNQNAAMNWGMWGMGGWGMGGMGMGPYWGY